MDQNQSQSSSPSAYRALPLGFVRLTGPDGCDYLVPDFFAAETLFAWRHEETMQSLDVNSASRMPKKTTNEVSCFLSEAEIAVPSDPPPSDREALALHAEVLTVQSQWGLSYDEAAHRLYMAEVRKLQALRDAEHGFRAIRERVDKTVELEICPALEKIDRGRWSGNEGEDLKTE